MFDLFQETLDIAVRNTACFIFYLYGSSTQLTLVGSDRIVLQGGDPVAPGLAVPEVEHSRASSSRFSC